MKPLFPLTGPGQLISTVSSLQGKNRLFPLKNNFTRASSWSEATIYSDEMFCVESVVHSGELFLRKQISGSRLGVCISVCMSAREHLEDYVHTGAHTCSVLGRPEANLGSSENLRSLLFETGTLEGLESPQPRRDAQRALAMC